MRISEGVKRLNLSIVDKKKGDYELVELFTTQDGSWEPSNKYFSVPLWALTYLPGFTSAGAATHAFVRVEDTNRKPITIDVRFGSAAISTNSKPEMWAIQQVSGNYKPDHGERGSMTIDFPAARQRIEGVGLPWNNHVSVFAIYRQMVEQSKPPVVVPPARPDGGTMVVSVEKLRKAQRAVTELAKALEELG